MTDSLLQVEMSETEYHAHENLGSTDLKYILRSPAHYKYYKSEKRDQTKAMNFGTAFHFAVLEPARFKNEVVVMPSFSGKGMYEKKDIFLTQSFGKVIVTESEIESIFGMLKSIAGHKIARSLLVGGVAEASYFWRDPVTGIGCKCRPDYRRFGGTVMDLKTTGDASTEDFSRSILNFGYHLSAAHYLDGVSSVLDQKHETFLILAIEKEPPFGIQIFEIDFGTLEKGLELRDRALLRYKNCLNDANWPGYSSDIVPISIPPYGFSL